MRTRVVVIVCGGEHVSNYFNSREAAQEFVRGWIERTENRIKAGDASVETTLLTDSDRRNCGILNQYIIGMYIPDDVVPVQERLVKAAERMADACGEGEDWKGS